LQDGERAIDFECRAGVDNRALSSRIGVRLTQGKAIGDAQLAAVDIRLTAELVGRGQNEVAIARLGNRRGRADDLAVDRGGVTGVGRDEGLSGQIQIVDVDRATATAGEDQCAGGDREGRCSVERDTGADDQRVDRLGIVERINARGHQLDVARGPSLIDVGEVGIGRQGEDVHAFRTRGIRGELGSRRGAYRGVGKNAVGQCSRRVDQRDAIGAGAAQVAAGRREVERGSSAWGRQRIEDQVRRHSAVLVDLNEVRQVGRCRNEVAKAFGRRRAALGGELELAAGHGDVGGIVHPVAVVDAGVVELERGVLIDDERCGVGKLAVVFEL